MAASDNFFYGLAVEASFIVGVNVIGAVAPYMWRVTFPILDVSRIERRNGATDA
jgi:hypothetical protein